jgi:hypothetical protein
MPLADWRRYTAQFTEAIRTAFPDKEIVHNALWFSGHSDPYVARELKAADYVDLERGVNDSGITAGAGTYGYETLQSHIDWLHSNGVGVVFDTYATTNREREYNLASYFLTSNGNDAVCTDSGGTPDDWYKGNDAQLGAPQGPRYSWNGVLRRDFANGTVLVNEPNKASKTLSLPGTLQSIAGQQTSSVTLGGGQGVVLQGASAGSGSGGSATTSVTKRSVRLAGRVQGARRGRVFMRITHRRAVSGRWVTVHRSTATLRSGRYRKLVRLARGHYRLSVSYHGPSRRLNGAVGRRSLTVR